MRPIAPRHKQRSSSLLQNQIAFFCEEQFEAESEARKTLSIKIKKA
jgi:hypothetical protein